MILVNFCEHISPRALGRFVLKCIGCETALRSLRAGGIGILKEWSPRTNPATIPPPMMHCSLQPHEDRQCWLFQLFGGRDVRFWIPSLAHVLKI